MFSVHVSPKRTDNAHRQWVRAFFSTPTDPLVPRSSEMVAVRLSLLPVPIHRPPSIAFLVGSHSRHGPPGRRRERWSCRPPRWILSGAQRRRSRRHHRTGNHKARSELRRGSDCRRAPRRRFGVTTAVASVPHVSDLLPVLFRGECATTLHR